MDQRASCLDEDPDLFFPVGTTGPAVDQIARAKAICAGCEVRIRVPRVGARHGQDAGVWGGLDEEERREIRRAGDARAAAAAVVRRLVAV